MRGLGMLMSPIERERAILAALKNTTWSASSMVRHIPGADRGMIQTIAQAHNISLEGRG